MNNKDLTNPHPTPSPATAMSHLSSTSVLRKNGERVQFTTKRMQEWFERHLKSSSDLQKFGFSSPTDVMIFLNSPQAAPIKTMIGEELAEIAAIKDYLQFYQTEEMLKKERQLLHLFMALSHKRQDQALLADDYREAMALIEKNKEEFEKNAREIAAYQSEDSDPFYDEAMSVLMEKWNQSERELQQLDKERDALSIEREQLLQQVSDFDNLNNFLEPYSGPSASVEAIEEKIQGHENLIQEQSQLTAEHLSQNPHQQNTIRQAMDNLNQLNLQLESLKLLKSVANGDKKLYDREGHSVHSLSEASFVLNRNKQLVKENGLHYLVDSSKKLPLNQQDKSEGRLAFIKAESDLSLQKPRPDFKRLEGLENKLAQRDSSLQHSRLVMSQQLINLQVAQNKTLMCTAIKNELQKMHDNPRQAQQKVSGLQKDIKKLFGETAETKMLLNQLQQLKTAPKLSAGQIKIVQQSFNRIVVNHMVTKENTQQRPNDKNKQIAP